MSPKTPIAAVALAFTAATAFAAPVPTEFVDLAGTINDAIRRLEQTLPGGLPAEREALVAGAVNGLVRTVDPSGASYLGKEASPTDAQEGVAVQVRLMGGVATVVSVQPHSKAFLADLRPGDRLLAVGDLRVAGKPLQEIEKALRGAAGTKVRLRYYRLETKEFLEAEVEREQPQDKPFMRVIDERIVYVQLPRLDAAAVRGVGAFLRELKVKKPLGCVLDFRSTWGGTLEDAVELAGYFLSEAPVAKVVGSGGTVKTLYAPKGKIFPAPLVVLSSRGTIGAAEIVMATLRENRRAVLLGEASFGDGVSRTDLALAGGWTLRIPAQRFQSPGGDEIQGRGVRPDIAVDPPAPPAKARAGWLTEFTSFCKGDEAPPKPETAAAPGGEKKPEKEAAVEEEKKDEDEDEASGEDDKDKADAKDKKPRSDMDRFPLVKEYDHQLMRAVNLLISTSIFFEQLLVTQ